MAWCQAAVGVEDHPRIRGEHRLATPPYQTPSGSSPHTRGAQVGADGPHATRRIIPAYAGSTPARSSPSPTGTDHPRIRGEHMEPTTDAQSEAGSSPHTRGAPIQRLRGSKLVRIIPAYAGSTLRPSFTMPKPEDHPRIRGEHSHFSFPFHLGSGSSPHTRGALCRRPSGRRRARIIPAYAGSTGVAGRLRVGGGDHPRIRGEHELLTAKKLNDTGSSPHTRGAPDSERGHGLLERIIPAYAGSTTTKKSLSTRIADHPRIRGEHECLAGAGDRVLGSSPHTRGALRG